MIVLRGAGRAFSAGVDLKVLQGIKPEGGIIGNVFDEPAARLAAAIRDSNVPVIARQLAHALRVPSKSHFTAILFTPQTQRSLVTRTLSLV